MVGVLDVARRARVSPATVSRVLNGTTTVSADTRARVLQAVETLGYQPNYMAQSLRRGRGRSVALVTGDIEQGIYAAIAKHVEAAFEKLGLDLLLFDIRHREDRLQRLLEKSAASGLRGVLLAEPHILLMKDLLPPMEASARGGVPVVAISQRLDRYGVPSIVHDDAGGAEAAIAYLHARGRTPVAFLGRIRTSAVGSERCRGYKQGLARAGLKLDRRLVWDIAAGYRWEAGYNTVRRALEKNIEVRAVLAASDELALGGMAAAIDHGLRIPDDIAFVGFGGLDWGRYTRPALTTVGFDVEALAARVSDLFIGFEEGKAAPPLTLISQKLITRDSA
jgi:DNA-binding LacI/PurR family transcriptional regulator